MQTNCTVGPLFFLVAAQAPMMQRWYASHDEAGDPYWLYAASNLGSFAGLIAYPLVLEPSLPLAEQSWAWAAGYALLFALVGLAAFSRRGVHTRDEVPALSQSRGGLGWGRIALRLGLSCGSWGGGVDRGHGGAAGCGRRGCRSLDRRGGLARRMEDGRHHGDYPLTLKLVPADTAPDTFYNLIMLVV